jgi:hypothetical protein
MKRKAVWDFSRLAAHYTSWVGSETNRRLFDYKARRDLAASLAQAESTASRAVVAVHLEKLCLWENKLGVHKILTGDRSGWGHLLNGTDFQALALRVRKLTFAAVLAEGRTYPVPLVHRAISRCLAQAMALRSDGVADWCGEVLLNELTNPTGFLKGWDETPFHSFVAWLYATWRSYKLPAEVLSSHNIGVYEMLVTNWQDERGFHDGVLSACEYHCTRFDADVDEESEFWPSPFDIFPCEILAVLRVHRDAGIEGMRIVHPLLDSALGAVPPDVVPIPDPILATAAIRIIQYEETNAT